MAEQPVGARDAAPPREEHAAGNGVASAGHVPPIDYPAYLPFPWEPERPRVVIKADLLPALSVLCTVSLLGFAVGWLWSRLAPPRRMVISEDGTPVTLDAATNGQAESFHPFDGLALFILLGLAAGVVTGIAVWLLRERRGPVIMIAATLGSAVAGWLAMQLGTTWAAGRYPVGPEVEMLDVVLQAPQLDSAGVLLGWPLMTALTYGVLAAWNAMDDLGRRLG